MVEKHKRSKIYAEDSTKVSEHRGVQMSGSANIMTTIISQHMILWIKVDSMLTQKVSEIVQYFLVVSIRNACEKLGKSQQKPRWVDCRADHSSGLKLSF